MNLRPVVAVLTLLATVACSEPLEFADWTIPVPEGTPAHEFAFVPTAERTELLDLQRDLVITEGMGRGLYQPSAIAIAADGTIFVLDLGNYRIVAFDQDGNALREFGSLGQGPGQFQRPEGFGVAGDRVIVNDARNNRLSAFGFDGTLLSDTQLDDRFYGRTFTELGDDLMIVFEAPMPMGGKEPYPADWRVGRYTHAAELLTPIAERTASIKAYFYTREVIGRFVIPYPNPVAAIRPDRTVYITSGDQYQVLAVQPSGVPDWALRTSYRPEALTEERKEAIVTDRRRTGTPVIIDTLAVAEYVWPTHFAALDNIETDARGNLYVFPYVYRPSDTDAGPNLPVAVDVYSPEGLPLFAGMSQINGWDAAFGDYIFRLEDDPETGERVVAGYRIVRNLE